MVYSNILGQIRVGVRSGSITPPVPPTIFDQVSYTTIAGYSLRKLKNTYTGSAVRVRRTYDNSEMNIGFDSTGILDTNTIKSFVNAGKTLAEQDLSNWSNLPSYSGSIVSDQLIFNMDAATYTSGSTISPSVGSAIGTLTNISYDSANGGTLGLSNGSSISFSETILTQTNEFTVSTWVYINSNPTQSTTLLSWSNGLDSNALRIGITNTKGATSSIGGITVNSMNSPLDAQYIGRWVEIGVVKSASNVSVYINGTSLKDNGSSFTISTPSNLTIGGFIGRVGKVRVWNKALTNWEVLQTYNATCGSFNQDHDANAFIAAAGLTNSTHTNAVHRLVRDLKNNRLWNKIRVLYPFVGGTEQAHKFNLKDPRDSNSARRILFSGGWTHSSTGAQPNGTNGWANTFYNASVDGINTEEMHLSYYSRTNSDNSGIEIGAQSSSTVLWYLQLKNGGYTYIGDNNSYNRSYGVGMYRTTSTSGDGNFFYQRSNSGSTRYAWVYKNGSWLWNQQMANNWTNDATINKDVYIGAINNGTTASSFSNKEVSFASIGNSMTSIEIYKYNQIVEKFQTTLGRQIVSSTPTVTHSDPDIDMFLTSALITNATQSTAISRLAGSLKLEGIWTKSLAMYPMVGGNAASHRFNLKGPDFTLTFSGGWTHTSTGAKPNGSNSIGTTDILPSSVLIPNQGHIGFYTSTISTNQNHDIIAVGSDGYQHFSLSSRRYYRLAGNINQSFGYISSIDTKDGRGFSFVMRGVISADPTLKAFVMKNDVIDSVSSTIEGLGSYASMPVYPIYLSAQYTTGSVTNYSDREHQFTTIGDRDMTEMQAIKFGRIVDKYQKDLSRNSISDDTKYDFESAYVTTWYDQSGNGRNLKMETRVSQPLIYTNGATIMDGIRPSMQFDGWNDGMLSTKNINFNTVGAIYCVHSGTASGFKTDHGSTNLVTGIGTNLPSAINWTGNARLDNFRMKFRPGGDTYNSSGGIQSPSWGGTSGGKFGGQWTNGAVSNGQMTKESGMNVSSYYINSGTTYFASNFTTDSTTAYGAGYTVPNPGSLFIGGYIDQYQVQLSNMKISEVILYDTSFNIENKMTIDKNMFDYYQPFTWNALSDSDANYFSLVCRLTPTYANAVNTLVSSLKSAGLWNKMIAIHPIAGTTSYTHSMELKYPTYSRGTTTNWSINLSGTTHDATGIAYSGSAASYGTIYKALSDNFSVTNFHSSFYVAGGTLAGGGGGYGPLAWASPSTNTTNALGISSTTTTYGKATDISAATSSSTGYFIGTSLTDNKLYKNGILIGTSSIPAGATMSSGYKGTNYYSSGGVPRIQFGTWWGGGGGNTNVKQSFSTFGYGLTTAEAAQLNTIVRTYQTSLGRLV